MTPSLAPTEHAPRSPQSSRLARLTDPVGDFLVLLLSPLFALGYYLAVLLLRSAGDRE